MLAPAHRVGKMDFPAVTIVDVAERGGHPAFRHDRVRLAEQRLADEPNADARGGRLDRSSQTRATGADHQDVVFEGLILHK